MAPARTTVSATLMLLGHTSRLDQLRGLLWCGFSILFELRSNMGITCLFKGPDLGFGLYRHPWKQLKASGFCGRFDRLEFGILVEECGRGLFPHSWLWFVPLSWRPWNKRRLWSPQFCEETWTKSRLFSLNFRPLVISVRESTLDPKP